MTTSINDGDDDDDNVHKITDCERKMHGIITILIYWREI